MHCVSTIFMSTVLFFSVPILGTLLPKPLLKLYTPHSILEHKHLYTPLPVGNRTRYATATSAAWFHGHYLALLNLYGQQIQIYFFDEHTQSVQLIQEIADPRNTHLHMPEHIAISPDETLLILGNSNPPSMNIYTITPDHRVHPQPLLSIPHNGLVHNARFSPDGNYCACACFDKKHAISIYALDRDYGGIKLRQTFCGSNNSLLRTKAINFTKDGKFAIIAYALAARDSVKRPYESMLVVREFDQKQGILGTIVCTVRDAFFSEDICLSPDETELFVTDQAYDQLLIYPFNACSGIISAHCTRYCNPEAQLSFPHGISISRDGKYMAVSNYGDDSCTIYALYSSSH